MKPSILKLSFAISLLGIFTLLLLSNTLQLKLINISEISSKDLNKKVKIQGEIIKIKNYNQNNFQVIEIKDETGNIEFLISNSNLTLNKTQNVIITGRVTQYKDRLQIQAEKIILNLPLPFILNNFPI